MGTLADIPSDLARWYARRLKYAWTTSVNEGLGFFIAYTILICASAIVGQRSLFLRDQDESRLDQFLQSDHQVRDADRFVSALSVVLSGLRPEQRINQGACPPASSECERARNVLDATVQFAGFIAALAATAPGQKQLTDAQKETEIAASLSNNHLPAGAARLAAPAISRGVETLGSLKQDVDTTGSGTKSAATSMEAARFPLNGTSYCQPSMEVPGALEQERLRRELFDLSQAVCLQPGADLSGLQIPEENADFARSPDVAKMRVGDRITRAIGISFALEAALRASQKAGSPQPAVCVCCSRDGRPIACDDRETRNFTAAFFVSADSVLRYWRSETVDPVMQLPKNLLWAAREYFATYVRGDTATSDEYVSQPYIDIAGAGIVQTICRAVPFWPAPDAAAPTKHVAGVVCADLALREASVNELVSYIAGGPLVSAGLVRISARGEATIESKLEGSRLAELRDVTTSAEWERSFPPGWVVGPQSRSPTKLRAASENWYVVPIARSGTDLLAIALHPAPASAVGRLVRWAVLGSMCGAALILLTFTAQQSRRVSIAGRELARLRGLPVAVMESRQNSAAPQDYSRQIIIAGNDRAEEILQIRLPNFGLTVGAKPELGNIFDTKTLIRTTMDGSPKKGIVDYDTISESRRRGETTAYYVRFKAKGKKKVVILSDDGQAACKEFSWMKVTAGPVILPSWRGSSVDPRGRLESTVGIFQPVTEKSLVKKLDAIAKGSPGSTQKRA
jgi:hypothetical protein